MENQIDPEEFDEDGGPFYSDGPWAEGWEKRAFGPVELGVQDLSQK